MITQDKATGEVRLKDHPVRVEFLIHKGKKIDLTSSPASEIERNGAAKWLLETLGYKVESFEMRVVMQ